jgi:DNA-binding winged helix-turn-helix (wHTH) protein/TolB-like protein
MPEKTRRLYEFGPFVLDLGRHVLVRDGKCVALTPKTFDVLVILVENSDRMLSKSELMKSLWPKSFVEESNLTQQISMIRKALGENAGETPYIVTVQGRGYRFAAPVIAYSEAQDPQPTTDPARLSGRKQITWPTVALIVAGLAFFGYFIDRKQSVKSAHPDGPRRLAVLPLKNLRGDPGADFLGFSLADAVITKLGHGNSLTVRPSSAIEKYRNQPIDLPRIAADLQVDALLTGNFLRDGDDLRITSQLIDVKTQSIIWRTTFDLKYDRLLMVQDRVAQEIIKGLELSLSRFEAERLTSGKPVEPLAYE